MKLALIAMGGMLVLALMTGRGWQGFGDLDVAGDASVGGTLNVLGSKNFRIDHPLDPANRYLVHFASEGPEPFNVYAGRVFAGADGMAEVILPEWFELVNANYRYQLTALRAPAPDLHVAGEIESNRFLIGGAGDGQEISWEVRARRNDRTMRRLEAEPEIDKPAHMQGTFLDPLVWGRP